MFNIRNLIVTSSTKPVLFGSVLVGSVLMAATIFPGILPLPIDPGGGGHDGGGDHKDPLTCLDPTVVSLTDSVGAGPLGGGVVTDPVDGIKSYNFVDGGSIAKAINRYRVARFLQPIAFHVDSNKDIDDVAITRRADMYDNSYVGLINTKGQNIEEELKDKTKDSGQQKFSSVGLLVFKGDIGCGEGSTQTGNANYDHLVKAWAKDPYCKTILLNPNFANGGAAGGFIYVTTSSGYFLSAVVLYTPAS